MSDYANVVLREGYQGFVKWGQESGMIAPGNYTLPADPTTDNILGFTSVPSVRMPNGAQGMNSIGSYRDVALWRGNRGPYSMGLNIELGNPLLLLYGLRSSQIAGGHRCLPTLGIKTGAVDSCGDGVAFSWLGRFFQINSMGLTLNQGSPISANVDTMGVCIDTDAPTETITEDEVVEACGSVFTIHHLVWLIDGIGYYELLNGGSIQIQNGVHPHGAFRRDKGNNNPLSRTAGTISPSIEKVTCNFRLFDKLPGYLFDAAARSDSWGQMQFIISDAETNTFNPKTYTITIANSLLNTQSMEQVQAAGQFGFTADVASRVIGMSLA